jgi:hypothetical protein
VVSSTVVPSATRAWIQEQHLGPADDGQEAFQDLDRLVGAVRPERGRDLADRHVEADVLDRGEAAEPLDQMLDLDGGHRIAP